ncbi:MAG: sensor histidine kinase [Chloroflexota bacterium]
MGRSIARLPDPRRWPIRWWLAVVNALVAGGTLLVLGLLSLALLEGGLERQLADYLRNQATPVIERELGPRPIGRQRGERRPDPPARAVPPQAPTPPAPPIKPGPPGKRSPALSGPEPPPDPALSGLASTLIQELAGRDTGIVVYDLRFRVVAASNPGERAERWPNVPRDALDAAARGEDTTRILGQATRRTLVLLMPLQRIGEEPIGILEIATSLELTDTLRTQAGLALGVGLLLAVAVTGGVSLLVARAALGPLERVVQVTRRVAGGDLAARVALERQDEVGELALSFDQMVSRLEAAFAAQRRLVSDAAHELRTPLNGLSGTLEIVQVSLRRGDLERAGRLLATVEGELDRLGRFVNDLLTLSSLDEDAGGPRMTPVVLEPVLRDVVRRARILAPDHEIVARLDPAATAMGDRDQLERLFTNLLDNAVKYTPSPGHIEVTVSQEGSAVLATVSDTGRGIPPEDLPRIFDRLYRVDRARTRQAGGTGLGLAIVQAIVAAHGGQIEADSTPGQGTTIRVRLPDASAAPSATH